MKPDLADLTSKELKEQILTADYGGKSWKEMCLNELLLRTTLEQHEVKERLKK